MDLMRQRGVLDFASKLANPTSRKAAANVAAGDVMAFLERGAVGVAERHGAAAPWASKTADFLTSPSVVQAAEFATTGGLPEEYIVPKQVLGYAASATPSSLKAYAPHLFEKVGELAGRQWSHPPLQPVKYLNAAEADAELELLAAASRRVSRRLRWSSWR